jgi:hypothetical protein
MPETWTKRVTPASWAWRASLAAALDVDGVECRPAPLHVETHCIDHAG